MSQTDSSERLNEYGQPIGPALPDWTPRPRPPRTPMRGRFCHVVPLDPAAHAAKLYALFRAAPDRRSWTYLMDELPETEAAFRERLDRQAAGTTRCSTPSSTRGRAIRSASRRISGSTRPMG